MHSILRIATLLVAAAGMVAGSPYGPTTWEGKPVSPAPSPMSKIDAIVDEESASSPLKVGAVSLMVVGAAMVAL